MKQLTGQQLSPDRASAFLRSYFSSPNLTVLLADELDLLWTRKQKVLYEMFGWPGQMGSRLILLAVANTMDLHDRVMKGSTSSRLVRCNQLLGSNWSVLVNPHTYIRVFYFVVAAALNWQVSRVHINLEEPPLVYYYVRNSSNRRHSSSLQGLVIMAWNWVEGMLRVFYCCCLFITTYRISPL